MEKVFPIQVPTNSVRRSKRIRVPPLAHWRNERIIYELEGRRASGPALPKIKEIVRIDTPPQAQTRNMPRGRSAGPRKRDATHDSESSAAEDSDAGEVYAPIKSYEDGGTIDDYKIAVSRSAVNPRPLQGSQVRFDKLFQDGGYVACGVIDIAVGGMKNPKPTKHAYMNFAVIRGKVEVKVHRTAFVIGKGGVFVVPRGMYVFDRAGTDAGNVYSIKNVGDKDCRLFFSQAVQEVLTATEQPEDS
jgi:centromere protein C